jgi:branched-subunit amino acid ABC-type transport system permease component
MDIWWVELKLVKIILLAVVLSIIVYYMPSIFLGLTASTVGAEYKPMVTTLATSTVTKETLRAYAETALQTNTTEAPSIPSITQAKGLEEYYQIFIYNIILSMVIAVIVFTFTRKIYK